MHELTYFLGNKHCLEGGGAILNSPNDFRFGGKDLHHKEFTLEKSILVTLYGIILKSWSVTPTKLSPRLVFIT